MRMGSRPCDDMFNMSQDSTGEGGALTKGVGDNKNKTSKWPDDSATQNSNIPGLRSGVLLCALDLPSFVNTTCFMCLLFTR